MTPVLEQILLETRTELARRSRAAAQIDAGYGLKRRSLRRALERGPRPALIAEIKARSPSLGMLATRVRPGELAVAYARAGASAISVLTNTRHFGGSLDHLLEVRRQVDLPVLRKDFIIDPVQVEESWGAGADALLLIVAALPGLALHELYQATLEAGLEPLVEVHDEAEMERALALGARLVGINNRDLGTLEVDLETTRRLARLAPPGLTLVSESGIHSHADALRAHRAGARALLVGTALMVSQDPAAKAREILWGEPARQGART